MSSSWLRKARAVPTLMTTYRVGLLQAKAFRLLNARTAELLRPHGLRPLEWAMMGLLFDEAGGMRPASLAKALGVKPPQITTVLGRLRGAGLFSVRVDEDDRRYKCVAITDKGKELVPNVERDLRGSMRGLVEGVSPRDMAGYADVLAAIVRNGERADR